MNPWLIILLVSIIGLVKSDDDNVAMESETNYKVHSSLDFPRKVELNYNLKSIKSNLKPPQGFKKRPNFEKNLKIEKFSKNSSEPSPSNDNNKNQKSTNKIPDTTGAATQDLILLEPQQLYQEQQVNYQVGALTNNPEYLYQNKIPAQEGYESGYSNTVEHFPDKDEDYKTAIQQGSVSDIKRIVPKSTVSFKMYHHDKSRNTKPGKLKSEFQSNVFHEVPESFLEQTNNLPKSQDNEPKPSTESQQNAVHVATKSPTQTTYTHSTVAVPSLPNNYFQQDLSDGLTKYLSKNAGNFRIVAANPNFEMYKHKINSPVGSQKILGQNQGFANHPNFLKHVQAFHKFEDGLSDSFTQATKAVKLPQNHVHFDSTSEKAKILGHNHNQGLKHSGQKNLKTFRGKKYLGQSKKLIGSHNAHQVKGQHETHSTTPEIQIFQKTPILGESFDMPVKYESNHKPSNDLPKFVHGTSMPLTPEDYLAKYQRDVALIQNSWSTFKQANHYKVNENQNLSPEILTKPPDSFHFEINPLIDMGKNFGQHNFDHQKALQGSTTFDLKHAIGGTIKGDKDPAADTINASSDLDDGVKLNVFNKQTFPYHFPLTQKHHLKITPHHFDGDSQSSNSDFSQSSLISEIPDNKFFYGFQNLPEQNEKNKQLAKLVESDFQNQFSQYLKPQTSTDVRFSTGFHQEKQKENIFSTNVKPFSEHNFQHKKNNALVLQNQQIIPFSNTDWNPSSTRFGKSKKVLLSTELIPLMQEPKKKIIPILMKKRKNRSYQEGKGVYLKVLKKGQNSNRHNKLEKELNFDLMQVDSKKVNKYKRKERVKEISSYSFL